MLTMCFQMIFSQESMLFLGGGRREGGNRKGVLALNFELKGVGQTAKTNLQS